MRPGDLDLSDPASFAEGPPHAYLRVLRREAPVHWNPAPAVQKTANAIRQGFFVLSKYDDIVNVSRNPRLFSSSIGTPFIWDAEPAHLGGVRSMMLGMDPPQHVRYRRLISRGFTPKMVSQLEPIIRRHSADIVSRIAGRGECEFVEDLACELPLTLICELMGIPNEDRKKIFEWSNRMIGADDPDMKSAPEEEGMAAAQMFLYCNELAAKKKQQPDDTLVSLYVNAELEGERMTELEINFFFVLLAVAGNETTRNATSHFVRLLFEHPDQHALLLSDVDRHLPGAIEEALRHSPPVMMFCRRATADTEIRGVRIREGDKVYLSYPSANRDEEVFEDGDRFDITRRKNDHLSFGIGEHFCLGANLARMQLRAILREVLTRLPDLRPASGPVRQRSNFIHGIKEMRVRFTPSA
jgi:cytochrome P450